MLANTERGQAERFADCEARKLDRLPDSLLDWHDVRAGRLTVAEKRARGRETLWSSELPSGYLGALLPASERLDLRSAAAVCMRTDRPRRPPGYV